MQHEAFFFEIFSPLTNLSTPFLLDFALASQKEKKKKEKSIYIQKQLKKKVLLSYIQAPDIYAMALATAPIEAGFDLMSL